jgi:hypothetical protein
MSGYIGSDRLLVTDTVHFEDDLDVAVYEMQIVLQTIGIEGELWLDTHADGWRDHVNATKVVARHRISQLMMRESRTAVNEFHGVLRRQLAASIALEIVKSAELPMTQVTGSSDV